MFHPHFSVAFLLLAGIPESPAGQAMKISEGSQVPTRIMLLRDAPSADEAIKYRAEEIGRIDGAVRIAIPETGGHVLVLTDTGEVWAWGENSSGQLGLAPSFETSG